MQLKIVHVVNFFLPDYQAGTEQYVFQVALQQLKQGHEVIVVRPDYWGRNDYLYEGVPVRFYSEEKRLATKKEIIGIDAPPGIASFKQLIALINPSIMHFHEINGSNGITYFHLEAIHTLNIPQVFTPHLASITCITNTLFYQNKKMCNGVIDVRKCTTCALSNKYPDAVTQNLITETAVGIFNIYQFFFKQKCLPNISSYPFVIKHRKESLKKMASQLDFFIVLTEWYKQVLIANGVDSKNIKVVQQGVKEIIENKTINYHPNFQRAKKLIYAGRVTEQKGLHLLIKALENTYTEIQLDVYGSVTDEAYYKLCKELAEQRNVFIQWQGVVASEQLITVLKHYDALVLPSFFSEMSPLVIQEAYQAGIPVIASNAYGNAEQIVDRKTGLLFEFGNSNSLKAVINIFYKINSKGLWQLPTTFNSFKSIANSLENIYMDIIRRK